MTLPATLLTQAEGGAHMGPDTADRIQRAYLTAKIRQLAEQAAKDTSAGVHDPLTPDPQQDGLDVLDAQHPVDTQGGFTPKTSPDDYAPPHPSVKAGNALQPLSGPVSPAVTDPFSPESVHALSPQQRAALERMYTQDFPLLKGKPAGEEDWGDWARALWNRHSRAVERLLHDRERNRLFAEGRQFISSVGLGQWREPPKPREATRAVQNMVKPALQMRQQIVAEQRPGFRCRPETDDPDQLKQAEAQQHLLEYLYDDQRMTRVLKEASYWALRDGVCFPCVYWDADAGPWDEELPITDPGQAESAQYGPKGDMRTHVYRIEQVRVSSNATATVRPFYWVVREVIPQASAIAQYGLDILDEVSASDWQDRISEAKTDITARMALYGLGPDVMMQGTPTVERFTVYCEKSFALPQGLMVVVVGQKTVAGPLPLLCGKVPIFRFADGSEDPAFYPTPVMNGWIDQQMRVNMLLSKMYDIIRLNAGGRFAIRENTVAQETLIGGLTSAVSIKGAGAIRDAIVPLESYKVGADLIQALEREIKTFEEFSGWNEATRGSFSADQSGRAILAVREQVERIFAPMVNAASEAMVDWADINLAYASRMYDTERIIAVEGRGRPDLVRTLRPQDFDGTVKVTIDPETLMPMPRALKLFLLYQMKTDGTISNEEYRRRMPFAFIQNVETPDTVQYNRAQRVAEAIRQTGNPNALPMYWMDDEAIHQTVLQESLIFAADDPNAVPGPVRDAALMRWNMLAQQAAMKAGMMAPPPMPGGPGGPPHGRAGMQRLPATHQPFQGTNPSVPAGPAALMGTPETIGQRADAMSPQ